MKWMASMVELGSFMKMRRLQGGNAFGQPKYWISIMSAFVNRPLFFFSFFLSLSGAVNEESS